MRVGMNRLPAPGRARPGRMLLAVALAVAAAFGSSLPIASAAPAAPAAPVAPVRVPWVVRHELNRAEALLRRETARRRLTGDVQVLREPEAVVLRVPAQLLFEPDSESLRPALRAAEMLAVPTTLMRRRRHLMTRIEVYTDNIGGLQLNQDLSARRAASLAAALATAGIAAHRVQAYGRGSSQALASNDTPEGRTLNRRVEFVFARIGSDAALAPASGASAGLRPAPAAASAGG